MTARGLCIIAVVFLVDASKTARHLLTVETATKDIISSGICTKGYFQCENTTICVPQKENCDGKADCPNGSDEKNCDDANEDHYWDDRYKKRLSALSDDLDKTCNLSYSGQCVCRGRDILCGYKNLVSIPKDLPKESLDMLNFEGNNFEILDEDFVKPIPTHIESLVFSSCNIGEIRNRTFFRLRDVKELHFDNNELKVFPADVFVKGNDLLKLSLPHNQISYIHPDAFIELTHVIKLDLTGNKLTIIDRNVLEPMISLTELFLGSNQIQKIDSETFPPLPLIKLSLTENQIETLDNASFANTPSLIRLWLTNNRLSHLKNETFLNLTNLRDLRLDHNRLRIIELGVFSDVLKLDSLRLQGNRFTTMDARVLHPLRRLQLINFDRFEMCAIATHIRVCTPKGDGISSQEHMIDNHFLRTSVWFIGALGCTGNLLVLLGRLLAPTNNVVHSLYLRNLALSDLLMGIYLFAIAAADHSYRGVYLRYQYLWRHSYMCNICGFLSTLSCQSSVLILTLVTWDRFVSVTQPLARKQPSPKTAALTLMVLWLLAAVVSLVPLTKGYFGDEFYGSNGVCLPLHIHDPYAMGWEYSAAMFILINAMALTFICYAYFRMIREIRASRVACRSTRQTQEKKDYVARRFAIIVITDALCWVPVIVIKLMALTGYPIQQDVYAWIAIFVLPINSALNPVLYTLTTTIFRKQMRKMISKIRKGRHRPSEHQHSNSESGFSLSLPAFQMVGSTRRILSYRGTQSSLTTSKHSNNSCKRLPTAV